MHVSIVFTMVMLRLHLSLYRCLSPGDTLTHSLSLSALEFVYAQSPHSMRGMMVGLLFWIKGIFSTLSSLILFIFSNPRWIQNLSMKTSTQSCGFWYYLIFFVLGLVTFVLYVVVSRRYQNRTRGDLEHHPYYRFRLDGSTQLNR